MYFLDLNIKLYFNQFYLPVFGSSQTNVEKLLHNGCLKKTITDSGLTRFIDERTTKILRLNLIRNFGFDFAQFASFDSPIQNHSLYFGLSPASNCGFASRVPNAKLIGLLLTRINAMINSLRLC